MGFHGETEISWKGKEYIYNLADIYNDNNLVFFLLYYLDLGIILPEFYQIIRGLNTKDVELLCKESRHICDNYEDKLLVLAFLRSAFTKNKDNFSPNALYEIINAHLQCLKIEDLIKIDHTYFDDFLKESILILSKKNPNISSEDKNIIIKELIK